MSIKPSWRERIVHNIVSTPLESYALRLRRLKSAYEIMRAPQYKSLIEEDGAIYCMMERVIQKGMNCLDVGCHLGLMISQMQRAAPQGKHIAVEPIPYKVELLRKKFPQVQIVECALSDTEGQVEFFVQPNRSGFSGLKFHGDTDGPAAHFEKISVQCRLLDNIIPENHRIDFMKVDVEGAELMVLRGGEKMLARSRPFLLFECTLSGVQTFEYEGRDIYNLLVEHHGYQIYVVADWLANKPALTLKGFDEAMASPARCFNFLAVPGSVQ